MDFLVEIAKILGGAAILGWLLLWVMGFFQDDDWGGMV